MSDTLVVPDNKIIKIKNSDYLLNDVKHQFFNLLKNYLPAGKCLFEGPEIFLIPPWL